MRALTFSIVSAVVSIAYSLGCFFYFNQPFWGFTAICVGALVTIYPLYFEKQRINIITQAQLVEYLSENLPSSHGKSVFKLKLTSIKAELDSLKSGVVPLTYSELAEAAELRMTENLSEKNAPKYFALHIVDSARSLGVWGKDYSEYPYLSSYVAIQKRILNNGGTIIRLFLFEPNWLKENVSLCRDAINRHNLLYAGTINSVQTLCGVIRRDIESPRGDFSILDGKEVFFWERGSNIDTGAFMGGQYIIDHAKVQSYVNKWRHLSDNSYQPTELFDMLEAKKI